MKSWHEMCIEAIKKLHLTVNFKLSKFVKATWIRVRQ